MPSPSVCALATALTVTNSATSPKP